MLLIFVLKCRTISFRCATPDIIDTARGI